VKFSRWLRDDAAVPGISAVSAPEIAAWGMGMWRWRWRWHVLAVMSWPTVCLVDIRPAAFLPRCCAQTHAFTAYFQPLSLLRFCSRRIPESPEKPGKPTNHQITLV